MTARADILVFTPHPDDAEFGASGTVARLAREGKKIVYVVCTNGDKGTSDRNVKPADLARIREKEQRDAAEVLGVNEVVFLDYPDQGLEDTTEFRKELVRVIRKYRPDVVITASPYRRYHWHRDHRICGQVVLDAVFPFARDYLSYPELLKEGLEPHKVKEVWLWAEENPNLRSDITDTFETKLAALSCHRSQLGETLPADIKEWLTQWAEQMADGENFRLAEGFYRIEMRR